MYLSWEEASILIGEKALSEAVTGREAQCGNAYGDICGLPACGAIIAYLSPRQSYQAVRRTTRKGFAANVRPKFFARNKLPDSQTHITEIQRLLREHYSSSASGST